MDVYPLIILAFQISLALVASVLVIQLLRSVLGDRLTNLCRDSRSAFRETFTRIMVSLAPLLGAVLFAAPLPKPASQRCFGNQFFTPWAGPSLQ